MTDQQAELRRLKEQAEATERLRQAREHGNKREAERARERLGELNMQAFDRSNPRLAAVAFLAPAVSGFLTFIGEAWWAGLLGAVAGLFMGQLALLLIFGQRLRARIAGFALAAMMTLWGIFVVFSWLADIAGWLAGGTT